LLFFQLPPLTAHTVWHLLLLLQGLGDAAVLLANLHIKNESLLDTNDGQQLLELLEEAETAINGDIAWDG
jgi:hypothetical protein